MEKFDGNCDVQNISFFWGGGGIFSGKKCRVLFKSKFLGYYLIFKFNLNFDSSFQTKVVTFYIIKQSM